MTVRPERGRRFEVRTRFNHTDRAARINEGGTLIEAEHGLARIVIAKNDPEPPMQGPRFPSHLALTQKLNQVCSRRDIGT